MTPVVASPMALTATARLASRRSFASSRRLGSERQRPGHEPRWVLCIPPGWPEVGTGGKPGSCMRGGFGEVTHHFHPHAGAIRRSGTTDKIIV